MQNGITFILVLLSFFIFSGIILTYIVQLFVSPTTETPRSVRDEIINLMKLRKGNLLVDLGSGTGNFLREAAKLARVKGLGYEISPITAGFARLKAIIYRITKGEKLNVKYEVGDFFNQDYAEADVFYIHQTTRVLKHFEKKAAILIKSGQKIYAYEIGFPGLKPTNQHLLSNNKTLFEY